MKNGKNGKNHNINVLSGNTDTDKTPDERKQLKKYCFTYNNYKKDELERLNIVFKSFVKSYFYGEEVGKNGTPHLQGFILLDKGMRITQLKKYEFLDKFHFEPMKLSININIDYCSKDGKIHYYNIDDSLIPKKVNKLLDWYDDYDENLILTNPTYSYQKFILDIIKEKPDNRTIYWFYNKDGNVGKTTLSKYMSHHFNAINIDGNKKDILYAAAEAKSYIYLIDLPRSSKNHVSYTGIEAIKNGYYFSGKYESKMIIRNPPHVFIFSNYLPEIKNLSLDRWQIYEIYKNDLDYDCILLDNNNLDVEPINNYFLDDNF